MPFPCAIGILYKMIQPFFRLQICSSLYITYDGLMDPLGASQILPYIKAIAVREGPLHVLSFEKKVSVGKKIDILRKELAYSRISWTPLSFTSSAGILGKTYDLLRMYIVSVFLVYAVKPCLVHCRGHAPAQVGAFLKGFLGIKLLFDFRGLWVDERVDKGLWNLAFAAHRYQYSYWKEIERGLLKVADHVVVLTDAVVPEVMKLGANDRDRITVIPCCADYKTFRVASPASRQKARIELDLPETSLVLGYSGSLGRMYLADRFLHLLHESVKTDNKVYALILTPQKNDFVNLINEVLPEEIRSRIRIHSASRQQVAAWMSAIDILVCFIAPSYARLGTSPTKLAEAWASGIPAICNSGVGDVDKLVQRIDGGIVISDLSDYQLGKVAQELSKVISKRGERLRSVSKPKLSLEVATERYLKVYRFLLKQC